MCAVKDGSLYADHEDTRSVPFSYDFNAVASGPASKEEGRTFTDGTANVFIKIENPELLGTVTSKENFPDLIPNSNKYAPKEEQQFVEHHHWQASDEQSAIPTTNMASTDHLSNKLLNVQSHITPYVQSHATNKSGTPNSLNPYKVLPPVTPTGSISANNVMHDDFLLPPGSAMSTISGLSGLSPFQGFSPAASNLVSPRNSAKSNSRGLFSAARKRTLSVSPLSMDGIDINALIRVSPSSLLYSGSYNTSPLPPIGNSVTDQGGTYGHLGARGTLTPSGGSLSRQLLAATPRSMIMDHHSAIAVSEDLMANAFANVLEQEHLKHTVHNHNINGETFFTPTSNLTFQHPDFNLQQRVQIQQREDNSLTESNSSQMERHSGVHSLGRMKIESNVSVPSRSEAIPNHHRTAPMYSVHADIEKGVQKSHPISHTHYRHNHLPNSNVEDVADNARNSAINGSSWVCLWIDCNLMFKVSYLRNELYEVN